MGLNRNKRINKIFAELDLEDSHETTLNNFEYILKHINNVLFNKITDCFVGFDHCLEIEIENEENFIFITVGAKGLGYFVEEKITTKTLAFNEYFKISNKEELINVITELNKLIKYV